MNLFFYKALAAVIIFLTSIATTIYPLKQQERHPSESFQLGDALASGIFLGAALFHLLPDAIRVFNNPYIEWHYPMPELICACGFLVLLFLERFSLLFAHETGKQIVPYILLFMLTIHALIEGAALGIGNTVSETLMLFIAICAHKGGESFALCLTFLRHHIARYRIGYLILFFSCMTPLGIFLGIGIHALTITKTSLLAGTFDAFAAGTFLYISTLHHVHFHHHHEEAQGLAEFGSFALGLMLMAGIAIWA